MTEKKSDIHIYQTDDGDTRIDVRLEDETVWLSINQMAELFQRDKSVISRHIKNIYDEAELAKDSTVANFATVQLEGKREISRSIDNLDVIISVGYCVKSHRGTENSNPLSLWQLPSLQEVTLWVQRQEGAKKPAFAKGEPVRRNNSSPESPLYQRGRAERMD